MEFDSTTPIYIQIADDLRHQILIGALADGDRVMSTTEYATTYRINPATAAKAFALLVDEGLVEKRRGIGMFVTKGSRKTLAASRRTTYVTDILAPALAEGIALGLTADDIHDHVTALLPTLTLSQSGDDK